jgi:hypothetical protein
METVVRDQTKTLLQEELLKDGRSREGNGCAREVTLEERTDDLKKHLCLRKQEGIR